MDLVLFRSQVREALKAQNLNMKSVSLEIGMGETYVRDLLDSNRSKNPETRGLLRLAERLRIDTTQSLGVPLRPVETALVIGELTASGDVVVSEHSGWDGSQRIEAPEMPNTGEGPLVALRLSTDEFAPLAPRGGFVFYREKPKHKPPTYIGEICFVRLKSNATKVGKLLPGSKSGRFSLDTRAGTVIDVEIIYASPIVSWQSKRELEKS